MKCKFYFPYLLVTYQSICICLILLTLILLKKVNFRISSYNKWYYSSIFLSIMIFTGTKSLQYLPISFYTLLKNISIIVVAVIEYLFYKKKIFLIEFLSFICITVSSIDGNFYSHYIGYFWIFCNIISTTIYIISLKHTLNFNKGTVAESIFFPNCVAILVSFFMYVIFEHKKFSYFTIHIYMLIVVSSLSALLTSFSSALLLNNLSSTSFSMMGALNKIFMGFSGFIFLNENLNICKIFSINIGSLGLILYTYNLVKINK